MAIYQGDTKVSGNAKVSSLPLFTTQWQDHITNDASWLRSEPFSWQSGAVYVSAYNHLVNDLIIRVETLYCWNRPDKEVYTTKENPSIGDNVYIINNGIVEFASTINNISGNTIYPTNMQAYTRYSSGDINNQEVPITSETETVAGTTITFKRAADGHKIVDDTQVSNVEAIYNSTGVAWYYVLDTTNTRFKLPRSKYNFVGLRDNVGNYVAESLPNITGSVSNHKGGYIDQSGAFYLSGGNPYAANGDGYAANWVNFDASRSSSTYQNGAPVQQRSTQAYLYFFVGNTIQNETSVDVAELAEDLNSKVDVDLTNLDLSNLTNVNKIIVSKMSTPSSVYDDLTVVATGGTYTAPSNGYFCARIPFTANQAFAFYNATQSLGNQATCNGSWTGYTFLPVQKGDVVYMYYNCTPNLVRFVYAEGSKSEQ